MTNFYIDTEFTSFQGELLSLAIVAEDDSKSSFYVQFDYDKKTIDPWVVQHVIPFIGDAPKVSRRQASTMLALYFADVEQPHIVADWPEDLSHLINLLIVGAGRMIPILHMTFQYSSFPNFSSAKSSAIPHNALEDAKALRKYVLENC